jgi:hypothetical protein
VALPPPLRPEPPDPRKGRSKVGKTHILIGGARAHFESGRKIDEGEYLRPYKKQLVDVTVSKAQLIRALEFANTLFNALEEAGHRVMLSNLGRSLWRLDLDENEVPKKRVGERYPPLWSPNEPTIAYVGEVPVGLALVEISEAVLMRYLNGKYVRDADFLASRLGKSHPDLGWTSIQDLRSGRLRLIAYAPRHDVEFTAKWQEAKGESLLDKVADVVAQMPKFAVEVAARMEAAELAYRRKWQEYEEAEERRRRAEDRQKIAASHTASRDHLREIIADWANLISIDRFFAEIEERAAQMEAGDASTVRSRLALARKFIGDLDPMPVFRAWQTPLERYPPVYDDHSTETMPGPEDD